MSFELHPLKVHEQARPHWQNRRAYVRYRCALATAGKVYPDTKQEFQRGWVLDLSRGGAGYCLSRPLPEGQQVVLQIPYANTPDRLEIRARVARVCATLSGEWLVGFEFDVVLSDTDLDRLL